MGLMKVTNMQDLAEDRSWRSLLLILVVTAGFANGSRHIGGLDPDDHLLATVGEDAENIATAKVSSQ